MLLTPGPDYVFNRDEHLMVIGHQKDVEQIIKKL